MKAQPSIRSTDDVSQEEEIIKLRARFETHLDDYRAHVLEEERRYLQDMQRQEAMANNINNLMKSLEFQAEATKGLVEAWNAASFLQRFVKWASGFAFIGVLIAWYNDIFKG